MLFASATQQVSEWLWNVISMQITCVTITYSYNNVVICTGCSLTANSLLAFAWVFFMFKSVSGIYLCISVFIWGPLVLLDGNLVLMRWNPFLGQDVNSCRGLVISTVKVRDNGLVRCMCVSECVCFWWIYTWGEKNTIIRDKYSWLHFAGGGSDEAGVMHSHKAQKVFVCIICLCVFVFLTRSNIVSDNMKKYGHAGKLNCSKWL